MSPTWPTFAPDEIAAATAVLESGKVNYWTGSEGHLFEREFATYHDVSHAIAVANGTLALELALWALDIDGGEVIVPSRTFVATANAVRMRGARPVFAEVDRDSGNVTADTIAAQLSDRTRAVIVVHLGGWPCEIDPILDLCQRRSVPLIEDCAQAHGATHRGRVVGSFGTVSAFSFCQDKIMTTAGEGGMLLTSDEALHRKAWAHKDHGKDYGEVHRTDHPPGFRWLHHHLGSNYRLCEVQSAVGRVQLRKLPRWLAHRRQLAALYDQAFTELPALRVTTVPAHIEHAYYKYYVYVRPEALAHGWDRDRILAELLTRGVRCGSGSCSEVYLERSFDGLRPPHPHPIARELGQNSLMFLLDPTITQADVARTTQAVRDVLNQARR